MRVAKGGDRPRKSSKLYSRKKKKKKTLWATKACQVAETTARVWAETVAQVGFWTPPFL